MSYFGGEYLDKGCRKERQTKEKVIFALYVKYSEKSNTV